MKIKKKFYIIILSLIYLIKFDSEETIFYQNIKFIDDANDYLVLINKNNQLRSNYVPYDLEDISIKYSNKNKKLRKKAKIYFERMCREAYRLGFKIKAVSAYRDYDYQNDLFNYYVKEKGLDYALNCSAKPGHSEHQSGLAVDIEGSNSDYNDFENSKEFEWVKDNAHKYGFILRYPKGKEYITGFKYEPWHYRYVGIKIATYLHKNNLTLEEYKKSID